MIHPNRSYIGPQRLWRIAYAVAVANPIIRNAQEKRQLTAVGDWLTALGYKNLPAGEGTKYNQMKPGTYSYRLNVPVEQDGTEKTVNIPGGYGGDAQGSEGG